MVKTRCLMVALIAGAGSASSGAETAGHWRAGFLSIPDTLGIEKNIEGEIIGLLYAQHFSVGEGYLDLAAGGSFAGALDGPISGTITINAAGVGASTSGNTLFFNDNGDFSAGVFSDEPGWQNLECMVRTSTVIQPVSVLEGRWNLVSMDTPSGLDVQSDVEAVTDVNLLGNFGLFVGYADFDAEGAYAGVFDGPISGTAAMGAQGAVTSIDSGNGEALTETFRLNASGDAMITFMEEGGYHYFTGMLKAPASLATHELQGYWHIASINTPDSLSVEKNGDNHVIGVPQQNHFQIYTGGIDVAASGAFSGTFDGPYSGTATAGANGAVSLVSDGQVTCYINASKDVMMAVVQDEPGWNELMIFVRSIVPRVITPVRNGNSMDFTWPDDGEVQLQRSLNLLNWNNVVTSGGSYSEPLSTGAAYFRLETN